MTEKHPIASEKTNTVAFPSALRHPPPPYEYGGVLRAGWGRSITPSLTVLGHNGWVLSMCFCRGMLCDGSKVVWSREYLPSGPSWSCQRVLLVVDRSMKPYAILGTSPTSTVIHQGFTIDGDTRDEPKQEIGPDEDADDYFRGRAFFVSGVGRTNHECARNKTKTD